MKYILTYTFIILSYYNFHILNQKMVIIDKLHEYFWDNLMTKFPNQIIHVSKQDLSKIENIHFKYPISGVNLNGSLTYLSKLEHLCNINLILNVL